MKKLILVRHAKSNWPENTEDFDRPLAESGVIDATRMAKYIAENHDDINYFLTSSAKRTVETCKIFAENFKKDFEESHLLYNASERKILSAVLSFEDRHQSAALFSHNNGISNFANSLSENLMHFPTCGVAIFDVCCEQWSEFENATKKLVAFYHPGNL